jgi:CRISPR-associated protein Csb2
MTLVLEIEHLLGVAFAAQDQSSEAPDWPPQPDRVFSALVAAWGTRGEQNEERRALEWLEQQPAPEIVASDGHPRTAPIVFVPPNDAEGGRVAVLPTLRPRQARRFPAFRPDDPIVSLVWREAAPDSSTLAALNALAADTAYVGHSASLTRCRFRSGDISAVAPATAARRRVYHGRLAQLERGFHAEPLRRPSPGAPARPRPDRAEETITSVFSNRWLVLEHVDGEMPDVRAAALVAKELRNALMSGYREIGWGAAVPAAVSGHSPDGRPSSETHLAIAPLAFVGAPYASGAVFGFALIPPAGGELLTTNDFRRAVRAISLSDEETGRRVVKIYSAALDLTFAFGNESQRRSLDPDPYLGEARVWASCTPIVLDRHLKATGNEAREEEIDGLIRQACINIGLPAPKSIAAGKHSAIEGAPSAYPSGGAPRWTRWRLLDSLASRQLIHAVVEFPVPVRGPILLGAGRFVGLGLCRPLGIGRQR